MGYSGRYHAASLAAVFLALAIGILIGVGARRQRRLGAPEETCEQSLKSDLADARAHTEDLQGQLNREHEFSDADLSRRWSANLLRGQRIAVVALGGLPDDMKGDIEAVVGGRTAPPRRSSPRWRSCASPRPARRSPPRARTDARARRVARDPDALSALARRVGQRAGQRWAGVRRASATPC